MQRDEQQSGIAQWPVDPPKADVIGAGRGVANVLIFLFCCWASALAAQVLRFPIADTGRDVSAMVGMPAIIDGSQSHDPGGRLITFQWSILETPAGSNATIDASDPAPVFIPDLPGAYRLQLVVTNEDGLESRPAGVTLRAFATTPFPNARAGRDRQVRVGAPVDLDASTSYDPLHTPLTFRWSLVSVPLASRIDDADVAARDSARAWFTPDVEGAYVLRLEASNGALTAEDRITVTATAGNLRPIASAGDHRYVAREGPFALNGVTSFDPDAGPSPLGFAWSLVTRPANSAITDRSIGDPRAPTTSVTPDADGAYVFRLTVNDGAESDSDNVLLRHSTAPTRDAMESTAHGSAVVLAPSERIAAKPDARLRRPDFALVVRPTDIRIPAGSQSTLGIGLRARGSSSPSVARLGISGVPAGVTATFGRPQLALGDDTTLRLRVDSNVRAGSYPLLVTASGNVGGMNVTRSASVTLTVTRNDGVPGPQTTCIGADVSGLDNVIYVAPKGTDSGTCGASAVGACATIQRGIENCNGAGCAVLVRHGKFATMSTITLRNGVNVHGSCRFPNETEVDPVAANYRTVIESVPPSGKPAVSAESINAPTVVSGLVVLSAANSGLSDPAIVMVASQSRGLALTHSSLIAGTGIEGGPLTPGQASPGGPGGPAPSLSPAYMFPADSCPTPGDVPPPMSVQPIKTGGAGGVACAAGPPAGNRGSGGQGADLAINQNADCRGSLYCTCYDDIPTSQGRNGIASGTVSGGSGGPHGDGGCSCGGYKDGVPGGVTGSPGATGECAVQGGRASHNHGSFQGTTWIPERGGQGASGSVGSGGGGGGAGGMAAWTNPENEVLYDGLAGGGGGGGGCGGLGGLGGNQGGASIALVLVNSSMPGVADRNSIVPGPAGAGGAGSTGGVGGQGGTGGTGQQGGSCGIHKDSVCSGDVPGSGGIGGQGGQGGAGGGGASGSGGPSIGIALVAGSPDPGGAAVYAGLPGRGGPLPGGGGRNAPSSNDPNPCTGAGGSNGIAGASAQVVNFDTVAPAHLLLPGQKLMPGESVASPNGHFFVMQGDGNLCFYKTAGGEYLWCSGTFLPDQIFYAIMQDDGNLVLYVHNSEGGLDTPFYSGTENHPGSYLAVRDDGRIAIYEGATILWSKP